MKDYARAGQHGDQDSRTPKSPQRLPTSSFQTAAPPTRSWPKPQPPITGHAVGRRPVRRSGSGQDLAVTPRWKAPSPPRLASTSADYLAPRFNSTSPPTRLTSNHPLSGILPTGLWWRRELTGVHRRTYPNYMLASRTHCLAELDLTSGGNRAVPPIVYWKKDGTIDGTSPDRITTLCGDERNAVVSEDQIPLSR